MIERPFKKKAKFEHLRKVLLRETKNGPVPIIELGVDPEVMFEVTGERVRGLREIYKVLQDGVTNPTPDQVKLIEKYLDLCIKFHVMVGYDYVMLIQGSPLVRTEAQLKQNPQQGGKVRPWREEHKGMINSRQEFESYPWPSVNHIQTYMPLEYMASRMPAGMKVSAFIWGIWEDLNMLMGFENVAIKSIEDPELIGDILERLSGIMEAVIEKAAAHPATGLIFYVDDLGFKGGTMISPRWIRERLIPRYKRFADISHKHGKPFLFHACGQVDAIMKDLIEVVGIDGKHSFQDDIEPVEEIYKKYGNRISVLGGLDVDILTRGTTEQVRARTRQILEACAPGGGYCMGSGNSLTNYLKIENYYAMLDETRKWNEEHE